MVVANARPDLLVDEGANPIAEMGLPLGELEVYRRSRCQIQRAGASGQAAAGRSSRKFSRALAIGWARSFCQAKASTLAILVPSRSTIAVA